MNGINELLIDSVPAYGLDMFKCKISERLATYTLIHKC